MKYIAHKKRSNEPDDFSEYRETTEGARYNGGNFSVPTLRDRLLEEQGYICAYCMGKLESEEEAHVEHYCPQKACPERDLDYMNLLAVCNGLAQSHPEKEEFHHCDKTKGREGKINGNVKLKKLDPTDSSCEALVTYSLSGHIESTNNDEEVEHDLNVVLNLNNKALLQRRQAAMDRAKELLIKEVPSKRWDQTIFQRHRALWLALRKKKGKYMYRAYCMAAVWLLDELMKKPKYQ